MDSVATQNPEYESAVRSWERRAPWFRRTSARLGLQGKLVFCFVALLAAGLGGSCWIFISQSSASLVDMMGEQARQISYALALGSKPALSQGHSEELYRIGQDLIKSRNVLFVAFLDANAKPITWASRDPDFSWSSATLGAQSTSGLMQVRSEHSALFGEYLQVIAPVVGIIPGTPAKPDAKIAEFPAGTRLIGYVAVAMSQSREQAQLRRINIYATAIGCMIVILSIPMAYMLIHRVFSPIRQLVAATIKIAAGDLDAQVAVHRPDQIGTLARSFNEMVRRVKGQQDNLEQKVMQRTAQLETANKRLSSEIAEKEDFLRAVSHDLNAPLRNISGMATMLLMKNREKFDDDIIHRLERIQKNVEVETDLIAELLELSRIKTRRHKMENTDLVALIKEIGGVFEEDLGSKDIKLVVDTELPALNCERARLRQVFQNLIDNAIKYMGDKPEKEIHVGCILRPSEAEFYVRDTGMGIDPEDIDKVFFVFRRGKNSSVQNVAGKGIGLASVKSIIETYSGTIWVESTRDVGSTFKFTINGKHVAMTGHPREPEPKQDNTAALAAVA